METSKHQRRVQRGTIYIEVLLALMPLLISFLGITQLALLHMGQLVVTHAASRAVRAAVVILDDAPQYYDNAPRNDLDARVARDQAGILKALEDLNDGYAELTSGTQVQGGARLNAIRQAAYHPLSVLAPAVGGEKTLEQEVGGSPWIRIALGSLLYTRAAASVSVNTPSGPRSPVTVKVAYLVSCGVPLVGPLMCTSGPELIAAGILPTSKRESEATEKMAHVASPLLRDALLTSGGHYRVLTAEATLPNQGAEYHK